MNDLGRKEMHTNSSTSLFEWSGTFKSALVFLFLVLLGSHMLDNVLYLFVVASLVLIEWQYVRSKEFIILFLFILSVYVTWIFLDKQILYNFEYTLKLFSQGGLILVMYLLGRSISVDTTNEERKLFYFLYLFIIVYIVALVYSFIEPYLFKEWGGVILPLGEDIFAYFPHEAESLVKKMGMLVCFPNEYKRLNVNGGFLISTIIAYYLSLMAILLPHIIFNLKEYRANKFSSIEIVFLLSLSVFAIYLASEMGRRTVFVLLVFSLASIIIMNMIDFAKKLNIKEFLFALALIVVFLWIGYGFLSDTVIGKKMALVGLHDKRFSWWSGGIKAMLDYPFGGGHGVFLARNMKMAHNTWIDIGKDFGVIPFFIFVVLTLYSFYILVHTILAKKISPFFKHLIFLIAISFYAIMMIEPVFTSDKTFFAYIVFFFGLLNKIYFDTRKKDI